jgi:GAF domain-containing protein
MNSAVPAVRFRHSPPSSLDPGRQSMPSNDLLFDVLKRFASTLANSYDVADVLYELTEHAVEVLAATSAGVSLAEVDGVLKFVTASSQAAADLELVQQESQQGPCHQAYRSATAVLVSNIAESGDWPVYRSKGQEVGLLAVAGIPLTTGNHRLGAINIYMDEPRHWTSEDIAAASVLADMATSYVVHASELARAQRINEQLQRALTSRIVIEQAKGVIAGERGLRVDDAFELLRKHARRNSASLSSVADAVVRLGLRP